MNADPQLTALLRNWKAPSLPGDFDQNVWRRMRTRQPEPVRPWWQAWLHQPIPLGAIAALLTIALGGWAGIRGNNPLAPAFSFASRSTFTSAYLQLEKGTLP